MTFAASAVVMEGVASAEAAATAAEIAAAAEAAATEGVAATSGIEAVAPVVAEAAPTVTSGIEGANVANLTGSTLTDAGGSLMGPSGGPVALPTTPAPVAAPTPVATPLPTAAPQGIEQIAANPNIPTWANQGPQGPGINLTQSPISIPVTPETAGVTNPYSLSSLPADTYNMQTGAQGLNGINGANVTQPSALERGFGKAMDWVDKNPFTAAYAGITGLNALMQPSNEEPKKKPSSLGKYKMSSDFKGTFPSPNVYQPQYHNYQSFAEGGIAALAGGSNNGYPMGRQDPTQYATPSQMPTSNAVVGADYEQATDAYTGEPQRFAIGGMAGLPTPQVGPPSNQAFLNIASNWGGAKNLLSTYAPNLAPAATAPAQAAPSAPGLKAGGLPSPDIDTGVISEDDPDFAFTSPYQTAAGRLEKLYKKTHVPETKMAIAPALGAIDLTPAITKKAAQGGIMGVEPNLGGYAAGGNPRLLKGPGDGMSDNIPATINNKQPARLADGEFVIPADVVSHLGNGSTEAGAKQLHGMMDNVREARTGRKAQGKQIDPKKFMIS